MGRGGSGEKEEKRVFMSAFLLLNAGGGQEPDRVRRGRLVNYNSALSKNAAKQQSPVESQFHNFTVLFLTNANQ